MRRQDYLTDQASLFVRNHTEHAHDRRRDLAAAADRRRPRTRRASLSLADLRRAAPDPHHRDPRVHRQRPVVLRQPAGPTRRGTAWRLGAVGAVAWEGVRLADVLDLAGLRDDAVSVLATGLDPRVRPPAG